MSRKLVLILIFLMLYGSFAFPFARLVVADPLQSDGFTIRADGSIYPSTSLISTSDNITYTLTGNITSSNDGIIIERNNTVIDGSGYSVQGSANGTGFWNGLFLSNVSNVTIRNTLIAKFDCGIYLNFSSYITLLDNNISANNQMGIHLESSCGNTVSENTLTNNYGYGTMLDNSSFFDLMSGSGIDLSSSSNNSIVGNNIDNNYQYGISLGSSSNNNIDDNSVTNNWFGIEFSSSSNDNIAGNVISENSIYGIRLESCCKNSISGNNITNNEGGIGLDFSNDSRIFGNWITQNRWEDGIGLWFSSNNIVYHNNFVNNSEQIYDFGWLHYGSASSVSLLDNGFEGNYWSSYNGTDSNQDGIGDTSYVADANSIDHYPLMGTFQSFNVSTTSEKFEEMDIVSNSTIEEVGFILNADDHPYPIGLVLTIQGQNGTTGFCRITLQNDLLNSSVYPVYMPGYLIKSRIVWSNGTYTTFYFIYNQLLPDSTVIILPEFPSFLVVLLFMVATLLAIIVCKKRHLTRALKCIISVLTSFEVCSPEPIRVFSPISFYYVPH